MCHLSRRPGQWSSRACLAAAVGVLALPAVARAQVGGVDVVARSWTFAGCGRGEIEIRPETILGDVICLTGLAVWGQTSAGTWRLALETRESPAPNLSLAPSLQGISSFARFSFTGPGCSGVCRDRSDLFVQSTGGGGSTAIAFQPSVLLTLGQLDPASLQLTDVDLFYVYRPRGSQGDPSEFGVQVSATPTLVPEPATAALTLSGLGLLCLGSAWRARGRAARGRAPVV